MGVSALDASIRTRDESPASLAPTKRSIPRRPSFGPSARYARCTFKSRVPVLGSHANQVPRPSDDVHSQISGPRRIQPGQMGQVHRSGAGLFARRAPWSHSGSQQFSRDAYGPPMRSVDHTAEGCAVEDPGELKQRAVWDFETVRAPLSPSLHALCLSRFSRKVVMRC
ncbi:hypothetical protein BD413DRAFT_53549 [Trametes elegans]|nr:hypothetical protein BD413DRAFT_53549 [Trametes elegans]